MIPKTKLKDSEIRRVLENYDSRTKNLEEDSRSIKANSVIQNFLGLSKADILALTAQQREILIFKVLKALCWSELDDA